MPEPVDRDVVNDSIEKGREWAVGLPAGGAAAQSVKIVFAQDFAHAREDVHDVVGFGCVATDRAKDQATVALDDEIPGAFFFTDSAHTELYTLSLHDALPI